MASQLTIELPDELVEQVRADARLTRRSFDETLAECIRRAGLGTPLDSLSDEEILAICDFEWEPARREELSGLLADNREGALDEQGKRRLEEAMVVLRRDLVRKSQALRVAVSRGLRPRLS